MSIIATCATVMFGVIVQADVVPDQPIPHVYINDPLIIELTAPSDVQADVRLTVTSPQHPSLEPISLDAVTLRAHGAYWWTVGDVPTDRGLYQLNMTVEAGGDTSRIETSYCRVDRVLEPNPVPVVAYLDVAGPEPLFALKAASVELVRLDASLPDLQDRVLLARKHGRSVAVRVDTGAMNDAEAAAETLVQTLGDNVARWEIVPGDNVTALARVARVLRRGETAARPALVVANDTQVEALLGNGGGQYVGELVFACNADTRGNLSAVRDAAQKAGYEGLPLSVAMADMAAEPSGAVIRHILNDTADGAVRTEVPASLLFDGQLRAPFVHIVGLGRYLPQPAFVGRLAVAEDTTALVFRIGARWTLALWRTEGRQDTVLPIGDAADLTLTDVRNNPGSLKPLEEGKATLPIGVEPLFLSGSGGTVLRDAAWGQARAEATLLFHAEAALASCPTETLAVCETIASAEELNMNRLDFFTLLKTFPHIEEQWHAGIIPRRFAVITLAGLARLTRSLCTVEQERGEPFIEPLSDMLARCREYQASYRKNDGAGSLNQARGDWLLDEVGRLMDEAKQLSETGRPIEADAVAALAEWRGRALEHAVDAAPLHKPDPFDKTSEEQQPEPEETDKKQ